MFFLPLFNLRPFNPLNTNPHILRHPVAHPAILDLILCRTAVTKPNKPICQLNFNLFGLKNCAEISTSQPQVGQHWIFSWFILANVLFVAPRQTSRHHTHVLHPEDIWGDRSTVYLAFQIHIRSLWEKYFPVNSKHLFSIYGFDSSYAVYIDPDSVALRCNKICRPGGIKKESQLETFPVIFSWSIPSPSVRDMTGLSEMKLNLMVSHLLKIWHNGDSVQVFSNEEN